jgi:hypothetical protein
MVTRISVNDSEVLRETIAYLKLANKRIQKVVRDQSRMVIGKVFEEEMAAQAPSRFEYAGLVATGRVKVTEQNVTVASGAVRGSFRNGLDMRQSAKSMEFGSNGKRTKTYTRRSRNGGTHQVTRRTMTQFGPPVRSGRVFYPAVRDLAPRALSLWTQTVLRLYHAAMERTD